MAVTKNTYMYALVKSDCIKQFYSKVDEKEQLVKNFMLRCFY